MLSAIKDFCQNGKNTGLLLVDMPTGSGKTHAVLEYISQEYDKEENNGKKFFFITTLKKNLPASELCEKFEKLGKGKAFEHDFLQIDSNEDCVLENLTAELEERIPLSIQNTKEYASLKQQADLIRAFKDGVSKDALSKEFRDKTEPAFRKMVQRMLKKAFKTTKARLRAVSIDRAWQWVGSLYPPVFSSEKRILFMSINKFFAKNTTIVEPSYEFINHSITDNAIIFIDEFDASKETILDQIIKEGLSHKINFLELFKVIHSAFRVNEFQQDIITPATEWNNGDHKWKSLEEQFTQMKEKSSEIFKKYKLQFSHRTEGNSEELGKNFLFQDCRYLSILDNDKNFVTVTADNKTKLNRIKFTDKAPSKDQNIQPVLHEIKQYLSMFQRFVNRLATNYRQLKKDRDENSEMTQEEAIRSVLDLFHLTESQHNYLLSRIMENSGYQSKKFSLVDIDTTIHTKGFRFFSFEDEQSHDMQSVIKLCEFSATPEKYLLQICRKAKVIGISATATLPSVIGNYDLSFLKAQLGEKFEYLPKETKQRIKEECYSNWTKYEDVNIHAELLDGQKLFSNHAFEIYARNTIAQTQCSDFDTQRYLRICEAYKNFLTHDSIKSFLCILTKHPRNNDEHLNLKTLKELFKFVAGDNNQNFDENSIILLTGSDFDTNKKDIAKRLGNGEKLFVISAYQTVGAGQNLQYPFNDEQKENLVNIDKYRAKLEKDFDAIYLDKPTHMLVNLFGNLNEEDFVKSIFQTEFMQEKGEISLNESKENIKKAFHCIMGGSERNSDKDYDTNLYEKRSVKLYATRLIIQAIGRICRTGWKSKDIYVFADESIVSAIDPTLVKNGFYNKEFVALLERIEQETGKPVQDDSLHNGAITRSYKTFRDIEFMLDTDWSKHTMDKWKRIREFVIRHPTISAEEAQCSDIGANYYIKVPTPSNKLFFKEIGDFQEIDISFEPKKGYKNLSESNAKLDSIIKYEPLANYFDEQGYAKSFTPNDYLMSPPLWSNIYKGALGEVAGEFLFRKLLGCELIEIEDAAIFEKFDYQIKDQPIFVDFKNWKETFDMDKRDTRSKILRKAKDVGAKVVIVANILAERKYHIDCRIEEGITLLVIPSMLIENADSVTENIPAITKIQEVIHEYAI